jgi:hypothetical protein
MDIKENEYVRTKSGKIDIFKEKDENYMFARCQKNTYWIFDITKHSKNLRDIIEVGDIVEYQVNSLSKLKIGRVKSYRDARSNKEYLGVEGFDITKIYIKSILTHEQYNANCYKVKGE